MHEPVGRKLNLIHYLLQLDDERKMTTLDFKIQRISNNYDKSFYFFKSTWHIQQLQVHSKTGWKVQSSHIQSAPTDLAFSPSTHSSEWNFCHNLWICIDTSLPLNSDFLFIIKYILSLHDLFIFFTQLWVHMQLLEILQRESTYLLPHITQWGHHAWLESSHTIGNCGWYNTLAVCECHHSICSPVCVCVCVCVCVNMYVCTFHYAILSHVQIHRKPLQLKQRTLYHRILCAAFYKPFPPTPRA